MSMLKFVACALGSAALIGVSGATQAESRNGLTISPFVGYYMYDHDLQFDHHEVFGGSLGYQFSGPLQLEAYYFFGDTEFSDTEFELEAEQVYLTTTFHVGREKGSHPYFLVGGGRQSYQTYYGDFQDSIAVAGAGYQIALGDRFSLRPDVRAIYNLDEETTTAAFMLGLQLTLGGKTQKAPVKVVEVDSDGDGVNDSRDSCPDTIAGTEVDAMGCELNLDVDGDGVTNDLDKCPDTSKGARVDEQGCYILITETKQIELYVTFEGGSSTVSADSYEEIRRVADFMNLYPLTQVLLAGHTDSSGSESFNQRLSLERAKAVAWLLNQHFGIDDRRIQTVGYGETQPLYPNDTPANRAKNRRVTATVTALVQTVQR